MPLSRRIKNILNDIKDVKTTYTKATDDVSFCDRLEQDLLHEFENENLTYHEIARLGKELKEMRLRRRQAKDIVETYQIAMSVLQDSQFRSVENKLTGALGNIVGKEKALSERTYKRRTKKTP